MREHNRKALVLCEGKDDMLVMQALSRHAGISEERLGFQEYGGETKLREYLATLKASPEYARGEYSKIMVTRDADRDFNSAWQSLKDSIRIVFSQSPAQPGDWITTELGVPATGWVIPGPHQSGMIETLFLDAVRATSPEVFNCLDPFVDCLALSHGNRPHEKVRFLLWSVIAQGPSAKDRLSVAAALQNSPPDWNAEPFQPLRTLLSSLVE